MSNPFGNLTTEGLEETEDRLGGFSARETDIYTGTITAAYAGKSDGGAMNVTLIFNDGKEYRETVYVSNKNGENFFHPKDKTGKPDLTKKVPLPGFTIIDDLCLVITNKPLSEQVTEEKTFNVYNADAKKELPTAVQMLTELTGGTVTFAIQKTLENKSEKVGNEYIPTADTREVNNIVKVFDTDSKFTVAEARKGLEEPVFWDAWLEKNKGQTQDKRSIKDGSAGTAGKPVAGRPAGGAPSAAPKKSLFAKNS